MITHGKVRDPRTAGELWKHALELVGKRPPVRARVLYVYPEVKAEEAMELYRHLFDALGAPSACIAPDGPFLVWWAARHGGGPSGVVVDCGFNRTTAFAFSVSPSREICGASVDLGGADVSSYLKRLSEASRSLGPLALESLKLNACAVYPGDGLEDDPRADEPVEVVVGEAGTTTIIGRERFLACEVLFRPQLLGKDTSLQEIVVQSGGSVRRKLPRRGGDALKRLLGGRRRPASRAGGALGVGDLQVACSRPSESAASGTSQHCPVAGR
ncbi:MAG: hypothetical protein Kow0069_28010 [Promethearchaeota archaeon]